ncbi:hypothetical protein NDU88_007319 [Pleurodeles waltl]|uniref:Reverse transcriptase domain-containing protein n=1 Tax=Pleurodeles waltl TaxID=8319 RepID=A0AAV7SS24_PLEWA|nr:hypothetical protein NDU88_007319 [Pleurodeles waltl]
MGEIVHSDQTCGVPGCRVADSLARIGDMIQYIKDRNIRAALVCLDQEKAFDHVSHEFMERVLQGFGLGERFCNYIRIMYTDIFSSVMVNGWKTDPFPISRTATLPPALVGAGGIATALIPADVEMRPAGFRPTGGSALAVGLVRTPKVEMRALV